MASSGIFKARVWICSESEEVEIQSVWDEDLTPVDLLKRGGRSIADWANESLAMWSCSDWIKATGLPSQGMFEILVLDGRIEGSHSDWSGEWDEDIILHQFITQQLPDDWKFSSQIDKEIN